MKAIVDCNNFYCSCERLFNPALQNRPVIVLSNNDGCIISRSDEAKKLGVEMAGPYFKAKPLIEKHNVHTFSSNYNLYGDLSWRVMETLRMIAGRENVEVYSVDEAFLELGQTDSPLQTGLLIKDTVEMWTGIKVSVGIAPTKVLSKLANRLAKKNKAATNCVVVLDSPEKISKALQQTPVEDIWGIGRQFAIKLKYGWNIHTAWELSLVSASFAGKFLGGVTGIRLLQELKGETFIAMKEELANKKMILTTRMFGSPVSDLRSVKEAIATYTARAAEKLRRQHGAAGTISVFIVKKEQEHSHSFKTSGTISSYTTLPAATSFTHELIKPALLLVEHLYKKGEIYKKAGVMLSNIVPATAVQENLFQPRRNNNGRKLMEMIDNINFSQRDDVLKFASGGTTRNWKMRQELRSPGFTTRWEELKTVH